MVRIANVVLCLALSHAAWGARVAKVAPEPSGSTALITLDHYGQVYYHWVINDVVCLTRSKKSTIACGRVAQYDKVQAVLRMAKANAKFSPGETVRILYTKSGRQIASTTQENAASPARMLPWG